MLIALIQFDKKVFQIYNGFDNSIYFGIRKKIFRCICHNDSPVIGVIKRVGFLTTEIYSFPSILPNLKYTVLNERLMRPNRT